MIHFNKVRPHYICAFTCVCACIFVETHTHTNIIWKAVSQTVLTVILLELHQV